MYELGMKNKNKRWDDKKIEASVLTTKERKGKEKKEKERKGKEGRGSSGR